MRIRNLNSFLKVATLGSFHAAATQLHTSQPAISARIATLEEELGVKLFKRDQSGTQLTTRGLQLLPYAEKLVNIANEMRAQLQDKTPEAGVFRIGIADTVAHLWLPQLLTVWREQYPLIQFELTIDLSHSLYANLLEHKLDVAFMVYHGKGDINSQPLCSYPQSWVATPEFAAAHTINNLADLSNLPVLTFPIFTGPGKQLQELFAEQTDMPKLHTSNSVAGLLTMAKQSAGVALLTDPLVEPSITDGSLVRLPIESTPPLLHFCSGWRQDEDRILPKLLADSARELIQSQLNLSDSAQSKPPQIN